MWCFTDSLKLMLPIKKRLGAIILTLGVLGSLLIGLLWRDSTQFDRMWDCNALVLQSDHSVILIAWPEASSGFQYPEFYRKSADSSEVGVALHFPKMEWGSRFAIIPIYLILLSYLASLLLAWLVLVNRLARRDGAMGNPIAKH